MRNRLSIIICFCLFSVIGTAQKKHIAYINAVTHIGNGQLIERGLVVVKDNKFELVTDLSRIRLDPRSFDTIIDLAGFHIYPALINANSVLGLHDAEAVRATVDFNEVGVLNSHVRALTAYNTDNQIIPTVRSNGVLYTQVTPRGNLISGSSSVMMLDGWNWEDAVLRADDGIHLNFPRFPIRRSDDEKQIKNAQKRYHDDLKALESFFADAKAYCKMPSPAEKNIRFEAMRAVFSGKANLYLHADRAKDLLAAMNFVKRFEIALPVIVGGKEVYKILVEVKKNKIPVMLNRVNDLPDRSDEAVDLFYSLPAMLQKDSILFCLQMEGDMEAMHGRNLPFNAGTAVGYGISKEAALAAISGNVAKILGVSDLIGTVEEGKLASFVVSEGDLLDMRTSKVVNAYIAGKPVVLKNRQNELYERYKNKFGLK